MGAWRRLDCEGRIDEFNARREEIRNGIRANRIKRKQTTDEAWRLALAEFLSLPVEPEPATADVGSEDESAIQENIEAELEELLADRSDGFNR